MPPKKAKAAAAGGGKAKGKGGDKKAKKAKAPAAASDPASAAPEDPVLKEYEAMELPKLEGAVAQLQAKLEGAQRERRHAQMEKNVASDAYRRLEGQLADATAALAREAREAEGLGWRHKLELRAYSDKAIALQHHHERRLDNVAEQKAEFLETAEKGQRRAEARWAARKEEARESTRALAEDGAALLSEMEALQQEELGDLRRQLEEELQALKEGGQDRLARASHAMALRHKVETHALEERRDQHLHDLLVAHQATVKQMRGYYVGILTEQAERADALEREVAALQAKATETQAALKRLSEEAEDMAEPLAAVTAREAELQSILKQQALTHAGLHRTKGKLRFLRRQHQTLQAQHAENHREWLAAEREREELAEGAESCVRRVEEEHERRTRELEARIKAAERELARIEGGGGLNGMASLATAA